MRKRSHLLRAAGASVALAVCAIAAAGAATAAPIEWKPLKVAVTDMACLNRDGRGSEKENRKFLSNLMVQVLRANGALRVEHIDTPAREAVTDPRVRQHDLAVAGDYIEMLSGHYRINIRLYDAQTRAALGAWSEDAPTWRGINFESKDDGAAARPDRPAIERLATQVLDAVRAIQVWRTVRDLQSTSTALRAEVKSDKPAYAVFETLSLTVTPSADAYVTLLSLNSTGGARVLFPRPKEESLLAKKNESLQVPGAGWVLRVTDQVGSGQDCFKVLVTREPLRLAADLLEPKDAATTTRLLEAIAGELGARPADAWGTGTCTIKVSEKQK